MIAYGIAALHRRKDLWGEDADDFRPERWANEKSSSVSSAFLRLDNVDVSLSAICHPRPLSVSDPLAI